MKRALTSFVMVAIGVGACGNHAQPPGAGTKDPVPGPTSDAAPRVPTPPAGAAAPYQLAPAGARGAIDGLVTLATPAPASASPATKNACGGTSAPRVVVGTAGGVEGAIVWIDAMPRGKAPDLAAPDVELSFASCRFTPRAVIVPRLGAALVFVNDDDVRHEPTVTTTEGKRQLARIPMPLAGQRFTVPIADPGPLAIGCALHPDEHAWAFAPPHPYYVATGADGRYHLADVPAGTYHVIAWHPPLTDAGAPLRAEATVTVTADAVADTPLSLK